MTANDIFDPSSARLPSGTSEGPYIMHVLPTCPLLNANAEMSNAGAASDDVKSQSRPGPFTTHRALKLTLPTHAWVCRWRAVIGWRDDNQPKY